MTLADINSDFKKIKNHNLGTIPIPQPLCESPEKMNREPPPGPPRLQRRNLEVFDSNGVVIAGTSFPSINLFAVLTHCDQDSGSTALSSGMSFTDT